MNRATFWPCLAVVILCGSWAAGREPLPPATPWPTACEATRPCGVGYTPGWRPRIKCRCACQAPLGHSVRSALAAQVDRGVSAYLTLHRYDFRAGDATGRLSAYGMVRLYRLARISMQSGLPIVVEADFDHPGLHAARRRHVLERLAAIDPYFSDETVGIGLPTSRGLRGEEVDRIHQTKLRNTQNRGPIFGASIGE